MEPASATSATLTLDAPLGNLWKGLRAKFTSTLQHTEVEDPISHQPRKWTGFWPDWQWDLTVRRDAGRFSYGFELNDNQRFTFYRTDEFDTNFNRGAYMTAFFEYRPTPRTAINFLLDNLLGTHAARDRLLFSPDRAAADIGLQRIPRPRPPPGIPDHPETKLRRAQRNEGRFEGQIGPGWRVRYGSAKALGDFISIARTKPWPSQPSCRSTGRIRSISITSSTTRSGWSATPPRLCAGEAAAAGDLGLSGRALRPRNHERVRRARAAGRDHPA